MFPIQPEKNTPAKGKILLAEPFLNDPYFKRTVVLLCEHNEEGSFGFVLNNYIDVDLDSVMEELPNIDSRISIGGPVKNSNLYYIHTLGDKVPDSVPVVNGIYMGGNFEHLKELLKEGEIQRDQIRFFVGYSGWSPQQLEDELKMKSWFVTDLEPELLMDTKKEDLWKNSLSALGKRFEIIANMPEDPSMN